MKVLAGFIAALLFAISAYAGSIEKWRDDALAKVASLNADSPVDEVIEVAVYLGVATRGDLMEPEHREVVERVKSAIFALPEHGDYFRDAIEMRLQNELAEAREPGNVIRLHPSRAQIFGYLGYLPSPQCVEVLGRLLDDDRDPWKGRDHSWPSPNSFYAVQTLNRIGVEGVPIIELRTNRDFEAAREQWKLWYAQVKSGNRTFRFKGDPQEYNLKGAVTATTVAATHEREPVPVTRDPTLASAEPRRIPWIPLGVALAVLLLAIGVAMKSRRTA